MELGVPASTPKPTFSSPKTNRAGPQHISPRGPCSERAEHITQDWHMRERNPSLTVRSLPHHECLRHVDLHELGQAVSFSREARVPGIATGDAFLAMVVARRRHGFGAFGLECIDLGEVGLLSLLVLVPAAQQGGHLVILLLLHRHFPDVPRRQDNRPLLLGRHVSDAGLRHQLVPICGPHRLGARLRPLGCGGPQDTAAK
mmetsp:Transcript_124108/g.397201  ORF Transcript_124108/g.397201 Transcript_124108/m.397201 type:complete len:201 (+) Transcript_124108:2-604(+)